METEMWMTAVHGKRFWYNTVEEARAIEREARENEMKKCHACGQKLPLQVGDVVEGTGYSGTVRRGIVTRVGAMDAFVTEFITGRLITLPVSKCVRLHGYYRITEREPLG